MVTYPDIMAVSTAVIPGLLCPSDNARSVFKPGVAGTNTEPFQYMFAVVGAGTAAAPSINIYGMDDALGRPVARDTSATNYLGVMGRMPIDAASYGATGATALAVDTYAGVFRLNKHNKIGSISDGTSNTVLFGEVTGAWTDGTKPSGRWASFSWTSSGLPIHWNAKNLAGVPYAVTTKAWNRFSSMHTGIVQWTLSDGSVKAIALSADADVMLRLGGLADGEVLNSEVLN